MKKRFTSLLLVIVMLLGMVPSAFAAELRSSRTQTTITNVIDDTTWSYLDDGSLDTNSSWTAVEFDASKWKTGEGPFGSAETVNNVPANTVLAGCNGTSNIATYFFRTQFTVSAEDKANVTQLVGVLEYDDAAIVYLNGVKIYEGKENGDVNGFGYAGTDVAKQRAESLVITNQTALNALQEGVNTVAVEVHNSSATDDDIWFHMNLKVSDGKQTQLDEFTVWSWFTGTSDPAGDSTAADYNRLTWTEPDYDDAEWATDIGPFGSQSQGQIYNNVTPIEIAATLLPGVDRTNNPPSYFFRTDLYIENLRNLESLSGWICCDDAAIVYVNGVAVYEWTKAEITDNLQFQVGKSTNPVPTKFTVTDLSALNLKQGNNTVAIELHQEKISSNDIWFDFELTPVVDVDTKIDENTLWAYLDDRSVTENDQWTAPSYNDSDWEIGAGSFGSAATVNSIDTTTVLDGCDGTNSVPTYLFRTQFSVPEGGLRDIEKLVGVLEYDDAAIVYLNGVKIYEGKENGTVTDIFSYAGDNTAKQHAEPIVLDRPDALKEGINTIAVEVHNSSATDTDAWFNLTLAPYDGKQEKIDSTTLWRYLADDTDPAGDINAADYNRLVWTEASYDDSSWQLGLAPFGGNNGGPTYANVTPKEVTGTVLPGTLLKSGTNYEAYFFRTDLYIEDLDDVGSLEGWISCDDAAIVYINGVAIYKWSKVEITENVQYAAGEAGNPVPTEFAVTDLSELNLQEGNNTVAIELHQDSATGGDIWLDFTLETSAERVVQLSNIVVNPGEDETQMGFTWYAPTATAGQILLAEYSELTDGVMPANAKSLTAFATKAADGNYYNAVTATNLEKGVKYAYQVVSGNHKSDIYSFTTGSGETNFSFGFVADIQIVGTENTHWKNSMAKMAENFEGMSFLLSAGDQVNTATSEVEYDALLDHDFMRNLPFVPIIGNHDNKINFQQHYEQPNLSAQYGVTDGGADSYFVYDGVLFLILNSNDKSAAEHKFFIEQAIAETKAASVDIKWKVVALHHSFYSTVGSSSDFDRLDLRTTFMPVFEELDIDVVLSGHDHVYARSYMLDGVDQVDTDAEYTYNDAGIPVSVTNSDGVLYVAASSPGYRCNQMGTKHTCVAVQGTTKRQNISEVEVTDTSFTITTYYTDTMEVLDTFTINKVQEGATYDQTDVTLSVGADATQMNVTWYSNAAGTGTVKLAKQSELVDGKMPETAKTFYADGVSSSKLNYYSYQTTMTGLAANTTYAYQLVNTGVTSEVYTITTDASGEYSFVFVADPQIGASGKSTADAIVNDTVGWRNTLNIVSTSEIFSDAAFMLSAGDQVNTASSEYEYRGFLNHDLMTSLPMATVIGNHDSGAVNYGQHFNAANESSEYGTTAAGGDSYFVYKNTLVMVLNSNDSSVAEHKSFMQAAVDANPDVKWKVVTFHHSIYTVASHAEDDSVLTLREQLVPVLDELDIDVALMGHDHVYCRTYIMDGLTPVTDKTKYDNASYSSVTDPDGTLYVTANSGSGSKHYNIKSTVCPYSAVQNQEKVPNVSKVTVSDTQFTITTYRTSDMTVVDTFTINKTAVEEDKSSDATLSALTVTGAEISPAFGAETLSYTASVANSVTSVTIAATANNSNATVSGDVGEKTLSVGANTFTVTVTAEDGTTTKSYTITIARADDEADVSTDATLSALTVTGAEISPAFGAETLSYTASVANSVTSVTIAATANNSKATVSGDVGEKTLSVGVKTFTITVTAEDGTTTKSYTVTITRAAASTSGSNTGSSSGVSGNTSTTTTTDREGNQITVTTNKVTGTVIEVTKTPDGTTGTVVTDKAGDVTKVSSKVSSVAVAEASKTGDAIALPVEVLVADGVSDAVTVEIDIPAGTESVKLKIPAENVTPGTVAIMIHKNGTQEIVKSSVATEGGVALTLSGDANIVLVDNAKKFADTNSHWAEDAIDFVSAREFFNGTVDNSFSPDATMTRAMLMVVLARFGGHDTTVDIGEAWYAEGMSWAMENGISDGSNPTVAVSREQLVTMLWRYAGNPESNHSMTHFQDNDDLANYATVAMAWAVEHGIVNGTTSTTLSPSSTSNRAQLATILMRFCQYQIDN